MVLVHISNLLLSGTHTKTYLIFALLKKYPQQYTIQVILFHYLVRSQTFHFYSMSSSNLISAHSLALVIQHAEKAIGFPFYQLEAGCIIHELNVCPADTFLTVFFLFILKNMLIEIILQMLISIVDTKLFKAKKNTEEYHLNYNS